MTTISIAGTTYTCPFRGAVPPLTDEEEEQLRADILAQGVLVQVVATETNEVLDGYHRLKIAADLGQSDVPIKVVPGLSAEEKLALAIDLNLHRRHLTRQQIREIVARTLRAEPSRSNNAIAKEIGVDDKTVGAVRVDLEEASEIPKSIRRRGRDGRTCSVKSRAVSESTPSKPFAGDHRGNCRGPFRWWSELAMMSRTAKGLAEDVMRQKKLKPAERTLEPVQKIAGRFRQLAEWLDEMVASTGGQDQPRCKEA